MLQKKNAEKATKTIAEKAGQRVGEFTVEKGSKQIRKLLQERKKQKLLQERKKQKKPLSQGAKKKTCKYFEKPHAKKIRRSCEIKSNFGK